METRTEKLQRIEIMGEVTKITIVEIGVNNTRTAYITVRTEVGEYRVTAPESGRTPDFDEIRPGTIVLVTGRLKQDGQIIAHNIEII
ncbi:MAG: OB-fold nucleic acid binding domain-containing protein [Bacteroidetes bacterium]|uniref:OB-fold nucleic acid binding domain-containing protein n=1 Tax=Candidatus Merdivivens pullicola TaxID=2840872 RepID=A0A9D9IGX9_9BACT|nr:OB-fold nucleic acid binding domain-containing protein [Candidatus Merdivivens pullicola]